MPRNNSFLGRLIGAEVRLRADDGRLLVIMTTTGEVVAEHMLVAPGEASVCDEHYGGPRPDAPRRVKGRGSRSG